MPNTSYTQGEVLLALMVFTDAQESKRRPVLVVHDFGDIDLLVVPITSHPTRVATDVTLANWKSAGLRLPSTVRVEKLATVEKSCIHRRLGSLSSADLLQVRVCLDALFKQILHSS